MELIDLLEKRGFLYQSSNLNSLKELVNSKKITFYLGSDPTGNSLHVGHLVPIMMARWFQKYGHRPIMLVGGATGRIGDPSGRDTGRPMMDEETIKKNSDGLRKSYSSFIKFGENSPDAIMLDNFSWMSNYSHIEFLKEFGTDFTVPKMLSMESVKRRLETGMTFLEFNYMTFQAVDFYTLYKKYDCILQLCGADQWGNAVVGIDLIRKKLGIESYVLSTPLIMDANGNKIGKSAGNAVYVNEDKTSVFDYYQYFRNITDDLVEKFLKIFTEIDLEKIDILIKGDINKAKEVLAFSATEIAHGSEKAKIAEKTAKDLFMGKGTENAPSINYKSSGEVNIIDLVVSVGLFDSKSEVRRMIEQGGLTVNDQKITSIDYKIDTNQKDILIRKGKKTFLRVNFIK